MIDLAIPEGSGLDPEKDVVGKLWFELIPEMDKQKRDAYAQTQAPAILKALADAKLEAASKAAEEQSQSESRSPSQSAATSTSTSTPAEDARGASLAVDRSASKAGSRPSNEGSEQAKVDRVAR